jgi:putative endonuclease
VFAVYIMTNFARRPFYTGFTGRLPHRTQQHKLHEPGGFTAKYNLHRLVYFELYHDPTAGIAREKQLQGWSRKKEDRPHRSHESQVGRPIQGVGQRVETLRCFVATSALKKARARLRSSA